MTLLIKCLGLTKKYSLVHTGCMQEYNISYLDIGLGFLQVLRDVLLEKFFVGPTHLRTNTRHDVGTLVFIKLTATLLLATDVFRVGFGHYDFVAFENLKEKFASMAEDKDPGLDAPGKDTQRVKTFTILVLVDSF